MTEIEAKGTTTHILVAGKFFKPDGQRLPVGEAYELTAEQVAAFGSQFKPAAVVQAEAEAATAAAEALTKAAEPAKVVKPAEPAKTA